MWDDPPTIPSAPPPASSMEFFVHFDSAPAANDTEQVVGVKGYAVRVPDDDLQQPV